MVNTDDTDQRDMLKLDSQNKNREMEKAARNHKRIYKITQDNTPRGRLNGKIGEIYTSQQDIVDT